MSYDTCKKGFSLIEILIVVGIVVLIASFGALNLFRYQHLSTLKRSSEAIVIFLRDAQSRSINQYNGQRWGVRFVNPVSGSGFYEMFSGGFYASTSVVTRVILPRKLQFFLPSSGSSSTVVFDNLTGLPNTMLTINLGIVGNSVISSTIIVQSNGLINKY
jgi:prepilin-type N-terminal cleavage/methylation domain-containing protein